MTADRRNARPDLVRGMPWPEGANRPLVTPLQPSVVYTSDSVDDLNAQYEGQVAGFTYSREGHPNAAVLASKIDGMEGASGGMLTGSGMGAVSAVLLGVLKAGDHMIGGDQLYGRSLRLMSEDLPRFGVETSFVDPTDATSIEAAIRPNSRLILVEVVSNPTLRIADMDTIYAIAQRHNLLVVVDNTFTTPRAYRPFDHGADIVLHSVTKLLAGHSDAMLGYVAARDPDLAQSIWNVIVTMGFTASPYDCWMAERGLYTFDMRFERACANAAGIADALGNMPGVVRVLYPGREDHPDRARARALLEADGNMVSFEIAGGHAAAQKLTESTELAFAPTLGDIGTTLSHPASSSHRGLSATARAELGMSDGFFRLSVGCEDADRLVDGLRTAVAASQHGQP